MNIQSLAPAPSRATTTITLSAAMLNIQLSVFTGTETTRVARKEFFNGDPSIEVGRAPIRKDTFEVIHQTDVVRMAQANNGNWVTLTDEEIAQSTSPRGLAEVVSFIPVKDIGNYLPENMGQVRPKREKGKPNPAAERAFALFLAGLKARKVAALVKVAMRAPARYAILTSLGDFIYVYTADAVRQPIPLTEVKFDKRELDLVGGLIDAIGIDAPVLTDDTAPVVQAYVDAKAQGMPANTAATPPPASDNLMAALEASIAAAKAAKGKVAA